jgi:D-3-phosphoglycerate dehydrogenase
VTRTVLISTSSFARLSAEPLERLQAADFQYVLNPYGRKLEPDETVELLRDVDGVIAGTERLDRSILNGVSKLKVISRVGTGLDNVDVAAASDLGIRVYNTPNAHVDAVAELALGGMLDVLRSISRADRSVRLNSWDKPMGTLLRGKIIGMIGFGRVARRLVELLRPFDVHVVAVDPLQDPAWSGTHGVTYVSLDELLPAADIVTLHLPYTPDAHHLINRERLGAMKHGAIVINCARGGLIDESALAESLRSAHLQGAFVDTFEREPYSGPLTDLPNVVLTPHIGGYTAEARSQMEMEAVENLLNFFRQEGQ